jgi:hypothetical protein
MSALFCLVLSYVGRSLAVGCPPGSRCPTKLVIDGLKILKLSNRPILLGVVNTMRNIMHSFEIKITLLQ